MRAGILLCVAVAALACSSGSSGGASTRGGGGSDATFPLDVSDDGRRLQGDNGEWFLMTGDAAWDLLVALDEAETETYLEDRRLRGFNTVLVKLIERGEAGSANANGDEPFTTPGDFTTPNEAYFAHVDRVIDLAAAKGILVLLAPAFLGEGCGSEGWCDVMLDQPVSAMESYGRFLGDRYRDRTNILWVHGGDARASEHGATSRVNAIANALVSRAPRHLHTAHCTRGVSAIECYDERWLDVNNTFSNCDDSLGELRNDYGRDPKQVYFLIEGNYENGSAGLGCLIDQYAWSVLAGGIGHVFGNSPIWHFGTGWEAELDSEGSQAMGHLEDLFESRAWFRLLSDDDVVEQGSGSGTAAATTRDRETMMIYTDSPRTVVVDASKLSGFHVRAWFFDPTDGSSLDLGSTEVLFGNETYDLPRRGVLVLDDDFKDLPRPGTVPY